MNQLIFLDVSNLGSPLGCITTAQNTRSESSGAVKDCCQGLFSLKAKNLGRCDEGRISWIGWVGPTCDDMHPQREEEEGDLTAGERTV